MSAELIGLTGAEFHRISSRDLTDEGLVALVDLAERHDYEGCRLLSCHRTSDGTAEAVLVEVYIELGQAELVNNIGEREPVAVLSSAGRGLPSVYPMREDFPQLLPHMNLNYRGRRRSLCLFDARPEDILHLYNPAMLVERVRWWMRKSAYGELHGDDQPLDPAIAPSFLNLVLPPDFDPLTDASYLAFPRSRQALAPILLVPSEGIDIPDVTRYACSHVVTDAVEHGAMIDLPFNVSDLMEIYAQLGVDLAAKIRELFDTDLNDPQVAARLKDALVLLITTPLKDRKGSVGATTTRAFISADVSLLDVASALGIAGLQDGAIARLISQPVDDVKLRTQPVMPLNVIDGFAQDVACAASGRKNGASRKFVAIGAGALGSQVVLNLARMGEARWHVIDPDFILPHNLARHAAPGAFIGCSKAEVLAQEINGLYQSSNATALHTAILGDDTEEPALCALRDAERVLDFSASVEAARWLAHNTQVNAPVSSYFVNPSGTELVALHEGPERSGRDGIAEMAYYAFLTADPSLHEHLYAPGHVRIGSCRDVSATIPQSRMGLFAGIAANDVDATHDLAGPMIRIWSTDASGAIAVRDRTVPQFAAATLDDWTVRIAPNVKDMIEDARGPGVVETGGILLGGFDREQKTLFVTAALPSPADSRAGRTYYERGAQGVQDAIATAELITLGHLTYIGEWHTHPAGSTSDLSDLDRTLLSWVADLRHLFLMPGLLLVLGDDGLRIVLQRDEWSGEELA